MRPSYESARPLSVVIAMGLCLAAGPLAGQSGRTVTKLADGVYAIEHGRGEGGNTTVIIGDRQVFVVDGCFLPSAAREDIQQIRQWTNKPVTFLLNTHFHNDHNIGNRTYMEAFPALTIIAEVETKKDMDMFGPGSERREQEDLATLQQMAASGRNTDSTPLSADDMAKVKRVLPEHQATTDALKGLAFQSATLTFDHDFTIDLGGREVQVKFLGRANTNGDAVVYLPRERIVATGDIVVHPTPYVSDGYPTEWIQTLDKLGALDATTIVPGHGTIMHDKTYIYLLRDFFQSAVDQLNARLRRSRPAMFQSVDDVKGAIDLTPFRQRFAGNDKAVANQFDYMAQSFVKLVFEEASLR